MKKALLPSTFLFCLAVMLGTLGLAEPAWAVENPKRWLMIFPAITVIILITIILVTRKR